MRPFFDSRELMLENARGPMGCNGLRSLEELGQFRQERMEKRLGAACPSLSVESMASLYATWLQERVFRTAAVPDQAIINRWAGFLASRGLDEDAIVTIWHMAALTSLQQWVAVMDHHYVRDLRNNVAEAIRKSFRRGPVSKGELVPFLPSETELTVDGDSGEQSRQLSSAGQVCAHCSGTGMSFPLEAAGPLLTMLNRPLDCRVSLGLGPGQAAARASRP